MLANLIRKGNDVYFCSILSADQSQMAAWWLVVVELAYLPMGFYTMTWGNPPKFKSDPPKKGKLITPEMLAASGSEDGHQAAVFCWAGINVGKYPELKWLHAIPNGGSRHIVEATKMVAAGLRSGIWDIFLPLPIQTEFAKMYAGLYIEMKKEDKRTKKNGGLSDEQLEFKEYAQKMGYYCQVCYIWEEARDILINYLELKL